MFCTSEHPDTFLLLLDTSTHTSTSTSAPPVLIGIGSTTQCATAFNLVNDLTDTIAVSVDSNHLPQRSAASSQHPAASKHCSYVDELRFTLQQWATGARQRLCCSCSRICVLVCKRHRDINSVRTSSDRRKLHNYVERKAESAVRGQDRGVCSQLCVTLCVAWRPRSETSG